MDTEDIVAQLVYKFNLQLVDLRRHSFTVEDLLLCLLELDSIKLSADALDTTAESLEHLLRRKLKPLFPTKERNEKWSQFLLNSLNLRRCPRCTFIKPVDQYYSCATRPVGLSVYCTDCEKLISKKARESNPEAVKAYRKRHYEANKGYYTNKNALRKVFVMQATPPWADLDKIREIYDTCPEGYHVDHKIPLQGEYVCGLHVESNLQHLPARENISKGNRYIIA